MINFTTRLDGEVEMICINDAGSYYEIPNTEKATLTSDYVNEKFIEIKTLAFKRSFPKLKKEFVYVAGNLVRTDVSILLDDASSILEELVANFPQYTLEGLMANKDNLTGRFEDYRPPYLNSSISYYNCEAPSSELLDQYGCKEIYQGITNPWYGLKHDLTTKQISLKVGFKPNDYKTFFNNAPEQTVDQIGCVFSRLHNQDQPASEWVDMYLYGTESDGTESDMRDFCQQVSKPFPLPEGSDLQCWSYSIVFNDTTGEINTIKGYVREDW